MSRRSLTSWLPAPKRAGRHRRHRPWLGIEYLEDRTMLDGTLPPDLVVGRTLSAYTTAAVQDRTVDITYTVYNQRNEDLSGVLLTTALQPGVAYRSASAVPDRSGSDLAWSLGTIPAYDRASVTVTVTLPEGGALQIDSGARAFATLNAGAVSADTPAAVLSNRTIAPELLASTVDADTADPFVQEQAARLRYDPQLIAQYLSTDVGYESYSGSLRGARGTIWSEAGNSLDEASLGVALLRASGIPARYAHGTLSDARSKQLILSMFPESYQTIGYIPAGTTLADPANDPQLLAETRNHYWVQLDSGGGFVDADTSGLPGSGLGAVFASATETFAEVADGLRHKVRFTLDVETYNAATAAFGLSSPLSTATVLDQTFAAVELVGRPVAVGHFVNPSSLGALFSARTTTYSPYLTVGDYATDASGFRVIPGTPYQELLTNFPLGTTAVTGVNLTLTETGPDGPAEAFTRALVDRIGYAARKGLAAPAVTLDPDGPPALTSADTFTVQARSGPVPASAVRVLYDRLVREGAALTRAAADGGVATEGGVAQFVLSDATVRLALFAALSGAFAARAEALASARTYPTRPRLEMHTVEGRLVDGEAELISGMDLIAIRQRTVAAPGENPAAARAAAFALGAMDSYLENRVLDDGGAAAPSGALPVYAEVIAQGIPVVMLVPGDAAALARLPLPADALARIGDALAAGRVVLTPAGAATIGGRPAAAWLEVNPTTGEVIAVDQSGRHAAGGGTSYPVIVSASLVVLRQNIVPWTIAIVNSALVRVATTFTLLALRTRVALTPLIVALKVAAADKIFKAVFVLSVKYTLGQTPLAPAVNNVISDTLALFLVFLEVDPPVPAFRLSTAAPTAAAAAADLARPADRSAGRAVGSVRSGSVRAAGRLTASWSGPATFRAATLTAPSATVRDGNGDVVGSGAVALAAAAELAAAGGTYQVTGNGSLSFYGPAGAALGASGEWADYSAAVTGNVTFTTNGGLTLNGTALPAGTYTITTTSATLTGSGATSAPTFAGAASVAVTDGAVNVGPGSGNLSVGGAALDPGTETTLDGFTGTLTVSGDGSDADAVALDGSAAHVLRVTAPGGLAADQNTPVTFTPTVGTSLGGDYTVSAEAPEGWTVTVDAAGRFTVTPAGGLPAGNYPVRVVARSKANPDLVAVATAQVAVTPTAPGLALDVTPDPLFTVPFNGAQVPSSFQAAVRNLGPAADSYTVAVSGLPAGFRLLTSGAGFTVPAGQTGIVGLYLEPVAGTRLPAPGTVLTFRVTATSTTDPSLTQTQTVTFTMPAVHAVVMTATPAAVTTTPGVGATINLTLTNVGNVDEPGFDLAATATAGLSVAGLSPQSLVIGQTVTRTVTLTPAAGTPLNTPLAATITATIGGVAQTVVVPVSVAVPGAAAIGTAAEAAGRLGQPDLAARLNELSTALTALVQNPADAVARGQATAALETIGRLLAANQDLAQLAPAVAADTARLAGAAPADVPAAVVALGNTLGTVGATLADAANTRFTLGFERNSQAGRPQAPTTYRLVLQNTGAAAATYDLAVAGLPAGVTAAFSQDSIALAPGQITPGAGVPDLTLTLTSTSTTELAPFTFTVTATARGAAGITRSADGAFTVRDALVRVTAVTTDPPFTDPGGTVRVSARVLNAVNKQQEARASFTVTAPGGAVVFTSNPVPVALTVLTTLTTADLGTFSTTGFARGDYTITVTVTDAAGAPIPGSAGSGTLLVGTPVSATLTTTPDAAPAGTATVTTTLQATSRETFAAPLTPVGTVAIPGASSVVTRGDRAYVAVTGGIRVVDIADPTNPQVLSTFGAADIPAGLGIGGLELDGDRLVALVNKFDATPDNKIVVYSLADPDAPVRLGQTPLTYGGVDPTGLAPFAVVDHRVYTSAFWYRRFIFGNNVFGQWGESVVVDVSNPAAPSVVDVVYNRPPEPNHVYPDGLRWPDGTSNVWQIAQAAPGTVLIGTTANTKNVVNGVGQLLVVDSSNPNDPEVVRTIEVPGMSVVTGIAVNGTTGLVIGSSLGWYSGFGPVGLNGKVVAARIDLTDPRNPVLGPTRTFDIDSFGMHYLERTANGLYVTNSYAAAGTVPQLLVFDPRGPGDVTVSTVPIPAVIGADAIGTAGNRVLTGDGTNLTIYEFGEAATVPATARVTVPNGVSVVTGSFNTPPTRTVSGPDGLTLEWDVAFGSGNTGRTFTWQSTVTGLQPGGSARVGVNGEVAFTSNGTPGAIPLPDQVVAGRQVIGITPETRTVAPGASTTYTVTLINPTAAAVTYTLSVAGVPAGWVNLPGSASVPADGTLDVTLTLTPTAAAALADYGFSVTATAGGATGSAPATLTVAGVPVAPNPESYGVVATMTPAATAGRGTKARYVVRLTNTGSTTATFDLSAALPSGVSGVFDKGSVEVPPGAGNFREVMLTVTPAAGADAGDFPVGVTAASAAAAATANGMLKVAAAGVAVALDRRTGAPGETFRFTVTNTGTQADTFDLAAGGPGGLVAALAETAVTLQPGESREVTVTTTPAGFAALGALGLTVSARSQSAPEVVAGDSAALEVPATFGLTAALDQGSRTLPNPGTADFLLTVNNTGNTEDQYVAEITGTTGPVTAVLIGLDGLPTQTIPSFRLPGLASGAIRLRATLTGSGTGTVTITVRSLADPARTATVTATVASGVPAVRQRLYAVGAGPGGGPRVQVFDAANDTKLYDFFAYDSALRGGVSVATADVTGDGVEDIVTGAGVGGGSHVKVFDGATGAEVAGWFAYEPAFRGGVWVAAADLDGDGVAEVVTGVGVGGGPIVRVWSVAGGVPELRREFLAFDEADRGGVTVAVGVGADGRPVIAAGSGPGAEARVRTFDALTGDRLADVTAFDPAFAGGVYLAAGDVMGLGGGTQFLAGPGVGGGPRLRVLRADGTAAADVFAGPVDARAGLTVAALDKVGEPAAVLVGAGSGAFRGRLNGSGLDDLTRVGLFEDFTGGVFVG